MSDGSGGQRTLAEYGPETEPNTGSDVAEATATEEIDDLRRRVGALEELLAENVDNLERLLDTFDNTPDSAHRPTHTDIRGYQ